MIEEINPGSLVEGWASDAPPLSTSYHDHITYIATRAIERSSEQWFHNLRRFILDHGGCFSRMRTDKSLLENVLDRLESLIEVKEQVAAEAEMDDYRAIMGKVNYGQPLSPENPPKPTPTEFEMTSKEPLRKPQYLYLCRSVVTAPVVGSDEDDALEKFNENFSEIVCSLEHEVPSAVKTEVLDRVHHLAEDSPWEGYHPHGDYDGPQESCGYYTVEAHEERKVANEERMARIQNLISDLTIEELKLLKQHFCSNLSVSDLGDFGLL